MAETYKSPCKHAQEQCSEGTADITMAWEAKHSNQQLSCLQVTWRDSAYWYYTQVWTKGTIWRDQLYPANSGTCSVLATSSTCQQRWSSSIGAKSKYFCCWYTFPLNVTRDEQVLSPAPESTTVTCVQIIKKKKPAVNHNPLSKHLSSGDRSTTQVTQVV